MKQALVVGGARSGKYIALLLNREGYQVTLTDINAVDFKDELEDSNIKVVDKGHPDTLLDITYDIVVKNPGIKYSANFIQKLVALDYKIYNETELALRYSPNTKVYAITGTNGKTTTVSQLYEMLKSQFANTFLAGNIGTPVCEIIYLNNNVDHLAIELSSFQLDGMYDFHADIANITNLQEDHLDYYNSKEDYFLSKQKVYKNQTNNDVLLVNLDDPLCLKYLNNPQAKVITYSLNEKADVMLIADNVVFKDQVIFNIKELSLLGRHNIYNALVAAIFAYLSDVSLDKIQSVLKNFKAVEHRIEYVRDISGVKYYNDSKATNPQSLIVALEAFDDPIILIAGGFNKHISFDDLKPYTHKVKKALLIGETKDLLADVFLDNEKFETLEEAIMYAAMTAKVNDVVLFSPACASFDQYKDYEERGKRFKEIVNKNN